MRPKSNEPDRLFWLLAFGSGWCPFWYTLGPIWHHLVAFGASLEPNDNILAPYGVSLVVASADFGGSRSTRYSRGAKGRRMTVRVTALIPFWYNFRASLAVFSAEQTNGRTNERINERADERASGRVDTPRRACSRRWWRLLVLRDHSNDRYTVIPVLGVRGMSVAHSCGKGRRPVDMPMRARCHCGWHLLVPQDHSSGGCTVIPVSGIRGLSGRRSSGKGRNPVDMPRRT